jgi:hypothetical protein
MPGGHLDREEIGRGEHLPVDFQNFCQLMPTLRRCGAGSKWWRRKIFRTVMASMGCPRFASAPWIRR